MGELGKQEIVAAAKRVFESGAVTPAETVLLRALVDRHTGGGIPLDDVAARLHPNQPEQIHKVVDRLQSRLGGYYHDHPEEPQHLSVETADIGYRLTLKPRPQFTTEFVGVGAEDGSTITLQVRRY